MALFAFTHPCTVSIRKTLDCLQADLWVTPLEGYCSQQITRSQVNHHGHDQWPFWKTRALHLSEARFVCTSVGNTISTCSLHTGSWSKQSKAHETWNWTTWRFVEDHPDKNYSFFLLESFPPAICPSHLLPKELWSSENVKASTWCLATQRWHKHFRRSKAMVQWTALSWGECNCSTCYHVLWVIETFEQDLYKYEPALQTGMEAVPRFKFYTHQIFMAACGFFQHFTEPQMKNSIIMMAINQYHKSLQSLHEAHNTFPTMSLALPSAMVSSS